MAGFGAMSASSGKASDRPENPSARCPLGHLRCPQFYEVHPGVLLAFRLWAAESAGCPQFAGTKGKRGTGVEA